MMSDKIHIQGKHLIIGLLSAAGLALAFAITGHFALMGVGAAIGVNVAVILSMKNRGLD